MDYGKPIKFYKPEGVALFYNIRAFVCYRIYFPITGILISSFFSIPKIKRRYNNMNTDPDARRIHTLGIKLQIPMFMK